MAVRADREDIVHVLIAAGADVDASYKVSLFAIECTISHLYTLRLFTILQLHSVRYSGVVHKKLCYMTPFRFVQDGRTALSVAAEKGYTHIVERLTAAGANPCVADEVR